MEIVTKAIIAQKVKLGQKIRIMDVLSVRNVHKDQFLLEFAQMEHINQTHSKEIVCRVLMDMNVEICKMFQQLA